ncbi:MAG: head-tail connector protein [Hyphomicrobiaceae bacterium]|nr:head-tail connector protein [Hyphomicrobiaceae bacterium]
MALVLVGGPAVEPVSLAQVKAHLRLDGDSEDLLVASLILTSRLHIEAALGLALVSQQWRLVLHDWPRGGEVRLPLRPIADVSEIRVKDAAGVPAVLAPASYVADLAGNAPRIVSAGAALPRPGRIAAGIKIDLMAGYGPEPDDVPAPIRHALLLLVAHWYEHRDPIEIGAQDAVIPDAVSQLLKPFRSVRI